MTLTFYLSSTLLASGLHTTSSGISEREILSTASGSAVTATGPSLTGVATSNTYALFTTGTSLPNQAAWGSGTYRCQLDVSAADSGITYGLRNNVSSGSTSPGHFARVDSALSSEIETVQMAEALFSGTGLKLATASWTPSSGSASDRLEIAVSGQGSIAMGSAMTLRMNLVDAFVDGPFDTAVVADILKNRRPMRAMLAEG